jgi:hypothetical protein
MNQPLPFELVAQRNPHPLGRSNRFGAQLQSHIVDGAEIRRKGATRFAVFHVSERRRR